MLGQPEHDKDYGHDFSRHNKTPAQSHHELGGFDSTRNDGDGQDYRNGKDLEEDFDQMRHAPNMAMVQQSRIMTEEGAR